MPDLLAAVGLQRRTLLVGGLAGLGSLLAGGCAERPAGEGGFVSGDGSYAKVELAERVAGPSIEGTTLDGQQWSQAEASGKVLVLNVWGSWCAPCRKEAPALVDAAEQMKDDAVFLGINTRDPDPGPAKAFVRRFKIEYVNLYDPHGELLLRFAGQLPPNAIPSTLVLDRQGRVAARIVGETTTSTLVGLVRDIAGEPA